jgi:replication factor A1
MSFINQEAEKVKVEDLNPRSRRVNLTAKVVSSNPVREVVSRVDGVSHRVTEYLIGDETGVILLTLWDNDIEKVKEGSTINLGNAYVSLFKGQMRLNIGKYGSLEPARTTIENVNTENNLSMKTYDQQRQFRDQRERQSSWGRRYERRGRRY